MGFGADNPLLGLLYFWVSFLFIFFDSFTWSFEDDVLFSNYVFSSSSL